MVKEQINETTAPLADRAINDNSGNNIEETYAPLQSPSLTGTPTAPTADSNTNTNQIATTSFVQNAVAKVVDSAPETLNTLNELSKALGDDPNFATTIANQIGTKLDKTDVVTTATPNKVLRLNADGKLDADITGNANTATNVNWDGVLDKPNLSAVATSGNYNDIKNTPDLTVYAKNNGNNTFSGENTFNNCPKTSATPSDNADLVNKGYVDGLVGDNISSLENSISSSYIKNSEVANSANKIPRYNSNGHLVLPSGAEIWVG